MKVSPVSANRCIGSHEDGSAHLKHYCLKGFDMQGDKIITCTNWRLFSVNCAKLNVSCNSNSSAYVAAVTVCNQKLF